jgi:cytoskeletal protein RodZ
MSKPRKNNKLMQTSRKLLVLAVLLLSVGAWYFLVHHSDNSPTNHEDTSKKAATQADAQAKKQLIESDNPSNSSDSQSSPPAKGSQITDLSAKQESNGTVTVFTRLSSNADGKCQLSIANGAKSETKPADIIFQPEFSTCAGFSIPIRDLGYGPWNLSLAVGDSVKSIMLEVVR